MNSFVGIKKLLQATYFRLFHCQKMNLKLFEGPQ